MSPITTTVNTLQFLSSPLVWAQIFCDRIEFEWIQCNQCLDDHLLKQLFTSYSSKEREMLI